MTPKDWYPIEAYTNGKQVIVMGYPVTGLPETGGHDCDMMGCGSVGAHVLGRFELVTADNTPAHRQSWHEAGLTWI
jgi:hypothetical protein